MTTTIRKWGNSQGIRIPRFLLDTLDWAENEKIVIQTDDGRLILTKAKGRKNIEELFEGFHSSYEPCEIDWGTPEGNELW